MLYLLSKSMNIDYNDTRYGSLHRHHLCYRGSVMSQL